MVTNTIPYCASPPFILSNKHNAVQNAVISSHRRSFTFWKLQRGDNSYWSQLLDNASQCSWEGKEHGRLNELSEHAAAWGSMPLVGTWLPWKITHTHASTSWLLLQKYLIKTTSCIAVTSPHLLSEVSHRHLAPCRGDALPFQQPCGNRTLSHH